MSYILRKCPKCGLYNDITVEKCECGEDITRICAEEVKTDIGPDLWGNINENLEILVQECPRCGKKNYTVAAQSPISQCMYCHKSISHVSRVKTNSDKQPVVNNTTRESEMPIEIPENVETKSNQPDTILFNSKEKDYSLSWERILNNILGDSSDSKTEGQIHLSKPIEGNITFTVIDRSAEFSVSFSESESPILFGRYSTDILDKSDSRYERFRKCDEFFRSDLYISGYQCYFEFTDGTWYIYDGVWDVPEKSIKKKSSLNGTLVNGKRVSSRTALSDGDIIKLGCLRPDAIRLRVQL